MPRAKFQSAEIAYDVLKDEYRAEDGRLNLLISKAQTLATVSALVFTAFSFAKFTYPLADFLNSIALVAGILSIPVCCYVIFVRDFSQVNFEALLKNSGSVLGQPKDEIQFRMAITYRDAIKGTSKVTSKIQTGFNISVSLVIVACLLEVWAVIAQSWKG